MKKTIQMLVVLCALAAGGVARAESNTLTVINGSTSNAPGDYYVGNTGTNNVLIITNAGTLNVNDYGASIYVGNVSTANYNSVIVTGPGSKLNNNYYIEVGERGSFNSLTITNGGVIKASSIEVGYNNGANNNSLTVSGTNSLLNVTNYLYIGDSSDNNGMTINKGGQVIHSGEWAVIGANQGAANYNKVVVTDPGSVWSNSTDLYVGYGGDNCSLIITNGGQVFNNNGYISYRANTGGDNVLVAGSNSLWRNSGALLIGDYDVGGSMTISNGGTVVNTDAHLGIHYYQDLANPDGNSVLVTGSGSVWSNTGSLFVGDATKHNTVTITNGGAVFVGGDVIISVNTSANNNQLMLAGGSLTATNAGAGTLDARYHGTLTLAGGTLMVNTLLVTNNNTDGNNGSFNFNYGTLTTLAGAQIAPAAAAGDFKIGNTAGQTATWNILGGTNSILLASGSNTLLGTVAGASASILVSGAGTVWTNGNDLQVGHVSAGNQMTISNGAQVFNDWGYIGQAATASNNSVTVTGSNSVWSSSSYTEIGYNGSGNRLAITNGGQVLGTVGTIGYSSSASNNTVTVTGPGSLWNNDRIYIGYSGSSNSLTVADDGTVSARNITVGTLNPGSGNLLAISGGNLYATNATGDAFLEVRRGTFNFDGGNVDADWLYATNNTASATNAIFNFNSGTLTIHSGAQIVVPAAGNFTIGNTAGQTATWLMSGVTNGIFAVAGQSAQIQLGTVAGALVNMQIAGAGTVWTNSATLVVGYNSVGLQLPITNGGVVYDTGGIIGANTGASNNTVTVTGPGSVWNNNGDLNIGQYGSGNTLTIANSGAVFNAYGYVGNNTVAVNNAVTVTGSGSLWSNSLTLYVGNAGAGNTLTITNGGTVNGFRGYIGSTASASNNSVLITGGGSVWNNNGDIRVGVSGSGNTLTITNGGTAYSNGGTISQNSNANNNVVLVTGSGSVWSNNTGTVQVGLGGAGNQLTIAAGGTVQNERGGIGWNATSSNNTVLVTGPNSVWNNSSYLYVGNYGAGNQLTISNGGAVYAQSVWLSANAGSNNTVAISGGSLTITNAGDMSILGVRSGTLTLNSGTLTVNQLNANNGASSVVQFNGGTLHTGGTAVTNGVPFVVGDGAQSATLDLLGGTHSFADGLAVSSNATLTGTGTLLAPLTLGGGATLSPGHSPGQLVVSNNLTLNGSSTFLVELAGYAAGSAYDQLIVTGLLTNENALLSVSLLDGFAPTNGAQFVIMDNASTGIGFFSGAAEGSSNNFGSAQLFSITYAGGADSHDIILTAIPEPGVLALVFLLGGALVGWRRFRRWTG